MTIQVRVARATGNLSAPTASISAADILDGDLVIIHYRSFNSDPITPPAGFVLVPGTEIVAATNGIALYYRVAGASEPANYDVGLAGGSARLGLIALYSDGAGLSLDFGEIVTRVNSSSTTVTFSAITAEAGDLLACFACLANTTTATPQAGMTKRYDTVANNAVYCQTELLAASGDTGTRTATQGASQASRTVTLAIVEESEPEPEPEPLADAGTGLRLYVHRPRVVLSGQVNQTSFAYPIGQVLVDNLTDGILTDAKPGMTVVFGTQPGYSNRGRQRIRQVGVDSTLYFGRSSRGRNPTGGVDGGRDGEVDLEDNLYFEVWDERRVWTKPPAIDVVGAGVVIHKDGYTFMGSQQNQPPPVANGGAGFAGTAKGDPLDLEVTFSAANSFAVHTGATISAYAWDVADGAVTGGAVDEASVTLNFTPGFRYVGLTVTDSSDNEHTTWIPVFIDDPTDRQSVPAFDGTTISLTPHGAELSVRILSDLDALAYPDGALVMLWEDEPAGPSSRDHMRFIGWHHMDPGDIAATRTGTLADVTLECHGVAGRLRALPGFAQEVRNVIANGAQSWLEMANANLDKYMHYLLHWHSTVLEVAPFSWSGTGDTYAFTILGSDGANLYEQVQRIAQAMVPAYHLTANSRGELRVLPDPMLRDEADRTATVQRALTAADWSAIRAQHMPVPRVRTLRGGALLANAVAEIPLFALAPGDAPGQGEAEQDRESQAGLAPSQTVLNSATGHAYARANALEGMFGITLAAGGWPAIEPVDMSWITVNIPIELTTPRLRSGTARLLPQEVSVRYEHARTGLVATVEVQAENETRGLPARTVIVETTPTPPAADTEWWGGDYFDGGFTPVAPAFDYGLRGGVEQVVAIDLTGTGPFIYRTSDFQTPDSGGGPTWTEVATTTGEANHFSWVVDPFSPGYRGSGSAINGWVVGNDDIWRLSDLFGVASATSVHTFAETAAGGSFHWRTIQASFGRYFPAESDNPWLLVVSYYGDTAGHTGVWATRSLDGGQTWSAEVQVSEHYDSGTQTRFRPIGVWMSPRTPGFAYAAAYRETGSPAQAAVYQTTDWGATWTELAGAVVDSETEPLPWFAVVNPNNPGPAPIVVQGAEVSHQQETTVEAGSGFVQNENFVLLVAPPTAKRVTLIGTWFAQKIASGTGFFELGTNHSLNEPAAIPRVSDFAFSNPGNNSATGQTYDLAWTATSDIEWPDTASDIDDVINNHPVSVAAYPRTRVFTSGNTGGSGTIVATAIASMTWRVTEIELQNGHIYSPAIQGVLDPGHALVGDFHIPWQGNDDQSVLYHGRLNIGATLDYSLQRVDAGGVTDVSPSDGTRGYGCNRYGFGIRAHDGSRQFVVVGATGNGTTGSHDDDWHAVYISSNAGDTWAEVVAPIADSAVAAGMPGFSAAFSGDSADALFIWGPPEYISYSDDFGATVDDRSGNLGTFGPGGFLGIAGGPTT